MVLSMTGYGRCRELVENKDICFEIKSVNSRYLDFNIKLGRLYTPLEERVKQLVSSRISRGKVDVYLNVTNPEGDVTTLSLNKDYLEAYLGVMNKVSEEYGVKGEVTLSMVSSKSEVFNVTRVDEDMEKAWELIKPVAEKALDAFCAMRAAEGKKLVADIKEHANNTAVLRAKIQERAPLAVAAAKDKMLARIKDLLESVNPDEGRLLTECAIFADKADINEEIARLGSHFSQLENILAEGGPVGRKLDFLVQEINREVNTIGSKSQDVEIARFVIDAKSEIEKIREQIQNLE
ncbi:MAG: YicC family protein [Clostridia bacterium]|nr:YicC family protein [Clostridia bacterium]